MTSDKNFSQLTSVCKRIVFFGSSGFSVPALEFLLTLPCEITVVTTPDQPKGRGLRLQPNPVKQRCEGAKIKTFSPVSLKDASLEQTIAAIRPELFVVASYGKLIPDSWLNIPSRATFNLHPSLLPKYRGAAPITWQILEGEKETGVSIAEVTKELDAGDLFCQLHIPLEPKETTASLTRKLAQLAVHALSEVLNQLMEGKLRRTPQDHAAHTYARKLAKEDGNLNLEERAFLLERKVRAFHPWPGAFIGYKEKPLRIVEASAESISCSEAPAGTLLEINPRGYLRIQTGQGPLHLFKLQVPGRRVVSGLDFANGERLEPGFVFQSLSAGS